MAVQRAGLTAPRGAASALPRFVGAPLADLSPVDVTLPRAAFVHQVMGLPMSLHVRGPEARSTAVRTIIDAMFARLREDDAEFSTYRDDSPVSRIRRGELEIRDASPRVREVAALCEEAARRTDGAFSAWLPAGGRSLFDPTGLVKGWAVREAYDRLVVDLETMGAHDTLMSAGGDVVVTCPRTDTADWLVGVEDPTDRSRLVTEIPLRRGAVATSGVAARGAHVIDPRTGEAARGLLAATVVGPDLMWADVYATAVLADGGVVPWFDEVRHDHAALVVDLDGTTRTIQG